MEKITITFSFVNIFSFLNTLPTFILIITNLFIIKSGMNQSDEVRFSKLLILAGKINICCEIIKYLIPNISMTDINFNYAVEYQFFLSYQIFRSLLFGIPAIITYGIFFIIFGKENREHFRNYLIIVGILWTFSNILSTIFWNGELFTFLFVEGISVNIMVILYIIYNLVWGIPYLVSVIFLIIHGIKNKDRFLTYTGIFFLFEVIFKLMVLPLLIATALIFYAAGVIIYEPALIDPLLNMIGFIVLLFLILAIGIVIAFLFKKEKEI